MIGAIYILNHKGDTIIHQILDSETPSGAINYFRVNIVHSKGAYNHPPVNRFDRYSFLHTFLTNGIWIVAVTLHNINCAMVFEYLTQFRKIINSYLGYIDENRLTSKFPLLIELFEDTIDNGYPQITDISSLKTWITQKSLKNANKLADAANLTNQLTGQITWRKQGIRYRKNEIFVDMREKVNLLMSSQGKVLSSSVDGVIMVRTFLSGMPECKFAINDKFLVEQKPNQRANNILGPKIAVALDDCVFHQCVKLSKYESEKTITFIPPDGKFELLRYRSSHNITLPFRVFPMVKEFGNTRIEMQIALKTNFKESHIAQKIEVIIPVPDNVSKVTTHPSKGRTKYRKGDNVIAWRIRKMQGMKETRLSAEVDLTPTAVTSKNQKVIGQPSHARKETRPPISVNFEAPFSCCGMNVRYLKVQEPKLNYGDHSVIKWVRNLSFNGAYEFRF